MSEFGNNSVLFSFFNQLWEEWSLLHRQDWQWSCSTVSEYLRVVLLFIDLLRISHYYTVKIRDERKMMLFVDTNSKFIINLLHRSYRNAKGVYFTVRLNTNKHERLISPQNSIKRTVGKYQLRLDSCCNLKQNL